MINCSGIGIYLKNILTYLIEDISIEYILIGKRCQLIEFSNHSNCKIVDINIPIFTVKELFQFPTAVVNSCDCFYTPNYNVPLGIRVPIISTIHDVLFLDIPNLTSRLGYVIRYLYLKQAIKRSKRIITVSQFSKHRIDHYFANQNRIVVAYNGIAQHVESYKLKKTPVFDFDYLLYVGNIKPHKGLKTLLRAYESVRQCGDNRKLLIVGEKNNFKTSDLSLKIKAEFVDDIIFTGRIEDEDLLNVMYHASLLVQPSIYEGFGIPPLEALYLGTPVIISDIPVFKEIYSDYPVVFFKSEDCEDLATKILKTSTQRIYLQGSLKYKYSYKVSANIIIETIKNDIL